jgi:hypothetical protein
MKTPTYLDLRNELSTWTDEERIEHIRGLAQLAAVALRQWTGEKGVYSKLFDRHTRFGPTPIGSSSIFRG